MPDDKTGPAPTSSATTRQTEPEVLAGITSAEGSASLVDVRRSGRSGGGRGLMLVAAGAALGYGAGRWLRGLA